MTVSAERYITPEGFDTSATAIHKRLVGLQPSLKALMASAVELFDDVYPQSPHPSEGESPIFATHTLDYCQTEKMPKGRELTVVMGSGKWIRVFRHTDSSPHAYPRERLWYWQPVDGAQMLINVFDVRERPKNRYDMHVADYDNKGMCMGFVGGVDSYREQYVTEAAEAIGEARQFAHDQGLVVAR